MIFIMKMMKIKLTTKIVKTKSMTMMMVRTGIRERAVADAEEVETMLMIPLIRISMMLPLLKSREERQ